MQIIAEETTGINETLQLNSVRISPSLQLFKRPTSGSRSTKSTPVQKLLAEKSVLTLSDSSGRSSNITKFWEVPTV